MSTIRDLKLKTLEHLGEDAVEGAYPAVDPLAGTTTTAEHLLSGIHAALNALSVRVWKKAVQDIAEDAESVTLPDDFIAVEGVYDAKVKSLIPRALSIGNSNAWIDYPHGTITFSNALESGGKLYYSAQWELPEDDSDDIEAPNICLAYLALYAASHCLLRKTSQQAELRQFGTKVDSGNPIQLPFKDVSTFFLKRAEIELNSLPATPKGVS